MDIPKRASRLEDGTFTIRTQGLHACQHAELEIVGVPNTAVQAAALLIDHVIEVVIEHRKSELKVGEKVGIPLSIEGHEQIEPIYIGARALESEPPSSGLLGRFTGKHKGVLRLADIFDDGSEVPSTAVASMMLHRANCRVVTGDLEGAIAELRAAIEWVPGEQSALPMPALDTGDAKYNWQNHVSYLRLAELVDEQERSELLRDAYSRFEWLAADELGATIDELAQLTGQGLVEQGKRIVETNLAQPMHGAGPHPGLRTVASPIWTPGADGHSVRKQSLIPAGFVEYVYGQTLQSKPIAHALAALAARCVERFRLEPWRIARITAHARELYLETRAPIASIAAARHPAHTTISALLAEAARHLRAGASLDEISAAFGLADGDAGQLTQSLAAKLSLLEAWEAEQYSRAFAP